MALAGRAGGRPARKGPAGFLRPRPGRAAPLALTPPTQQGTVDQAGFLEELRDRGLLASRAGPGAGLEEAEAVTVFRRLERCGPE